MSNVPQYLVLDIETEGLNPREHGILEIGAIAVNDQLETLAEFSEVCFGRDRRHLSDFIQKMHGSNGLLDEIEGRLIVGHAQTEEMLDARLAAWIRQQGYQPGKVVLAGNSVHFDHEFIKERMPHTRFLLHYHVHDISATQRELVQMAIEGDLPGFFDTETLEMPHRGLADARLELAMWRHQRAKMHELFCCLDLS